MTVVTLWSCVALAAPWVMGFPVGAHVDFLVGSYSSTHLSAVPAAQGPKAVVLSYIGGVDSLWSVW